MQCKHNGHMPGKNEVREEENFFGLPEFSLSIVLLNMLVYTLEGQL